MCVIDPAWSTVSWRMQVCVLDRAFMSASFYPRRSCRSDEGTSLCLPQSLRQDLRAHIWRQNTPAGRQKSAHHILTGQTDNMCAQHSVRAHGASVKPSACMGAAPAPRAVWALQKVREQPRGAQGDPVHIGRSNRGIAAPRNDASLCTACPCAPRGYLCTGDPVHR